MAKNAKTNVHAANGLEEKQQQQQKNKYYKKITFHFISFIQFVHSFIQ